MRRLLLATTAAAFVASAGSAMANTDSETLTVSAETTAAIALDCGAGTVSFGIIGVFTDADTNGATITLASDGSVTSSDSGQAYAAGGSPGVATCTVNNETGGNATAALANGGSLTLSDGGSGTMAASMQITGSSPYADGETFVVHGTLTVGDDQAVGTYSGTIDVTVTD